MPWPQQSAGQGQGQGQTQGQGQGQGQGQSLSGVSTGTGYGGYSTSNAGVSGVTTTSAGGRSTSSASTGAQTLSTGSQMVSLGNAGNTATSIDAANRSTSSYNEVFIPAVIPQTPPSSLAAGQIIKETSSCGPLMAVQRIPVTGAFFGVTKRQDVNQGFTETLVPYLDRKGYQQMYLDVPRPDGDGFTRFGHRVVQTTTVIGTAATRNVALGGGGGNSWGQAGGGASSSIQQMVTTIQLQSCEIGQFRTRPEKAVFVAPIAPRPLPPVQPPPPAPAPPPKPVIRKKAVVHPPKPGVCRPVTCK